MIFFHYINLQAIFFDFAYVTAFIFEFLKCDFQSGFNKLACACDFQILMGVFRGSNKIRVLVKTEPNLVDLFYNSASILH